MHANRWRRHLDLENASQNQSAYVTGKPTSLQQTRLRGLRIVDVGEDQLPRIEPRVGAVSGAIDEPD